MLLGRLVEFTPADLGFAALSPFSHSRPLGRREGHQSGIGSLVGAPREGVLITGTDLPS